MKLLDLTPAEIGQLLDSAADFKAKKKAGIPHKLCEGKNIVLLFEKDNKKRGVMVQGACRSNFVIFGLPICTLLCGDGILGKVAIAVAIVVPVLNIFAVFALEIFRGGKPSFKKILKGIATNPLIISAMSR